MRHSIRYTIAIAMIALAFSNTNAKADDIVETAVAAGKFKTLAVALTAADLVPALQGKGPFTVFAPTDDAFAKLPKGTVEMLLKPENKQKLAGILTYHVVADAVMAKQVVGLNAAKTLNGQQVDIKVNGSTVMIDGAKVVTTDIECDNGVIHIIDSVILPADKNLAETAIAAGKFKTLVAAAKAAGLVDALGGSDALTVFAPTDEAFAKLPKGTVESLLKPESKQKLAAILKFHIVAGRVYSGDALKAKTAKTLQGSAVSIKADDKGAMVNGAKLLKTDLDASNGVIHVIDSVLLQQKSDQWKVCMTAFNKFVVCGPATKRVSFKKGGRLYRLAKLLKLFDHFATPTSGKCIVDSGVNALCDCTYRTITESELAESRVRT